MENINGDQMPNDLLENANPVPTFQPNKEKSLEYIQANSASNGQKKRNVVIGIAILLVVFILILGISQYIKTTTQIKEAEVITTQTNEGGVTRTSFQVSPTVYKEFNGNCFSSKIADPNTLLVGSEDSLNCNLQVSTPDTTVPYVHIIAITGAPDEDAEYGAQLFLNKIESEFTEIPTDRNANLNGVPAILLRHREGSYKYRTYLVDVPPNSNYLNSEGKRFNVLVIKGFDGDPNTDVFTKAFNIFIENFGFK